MKEYFKYKYDDLFNPTLFALHSLGGSGTVNEIEEQVVINLKLTDKQINEIHRNSTTKLTYRLAWAKNYLKRYGLLINSSRGVWTLTKEGLETKSVNKELVKRKVVALDKKERLLGKKFDTQEQEEDAENEEIQQFSWQEQIISELKSISAESFERLCQRLLRELGFQNVEVTGRVNDGGIDGRGMLKLGGVLSFHVIFQAKRYKGSVSPSIVRDFRGAMMGRADKGLIITTGTFTREARKEAQRDGASPIDLMDGSDLAENLKILGLGVELIEKVEIKRDWFQSL